MSKHHKKSQSEHAVKAQTDGRKNKQVQVRDLIKQQEEREVIETEYPRASWWREEIHGASALAERQRLRATGQINRAIRGPRFGFLDWKKWKDSSKAPYSVEVEGFQ